MTQGIYEIVNLCDGKTTAYVGSSQDIARRWSQHRSLLHNGRHFNAHLQRAWILYGEDAFAFHVLEEVKTDMLLAKEQEYLNDCLNQEHCYNIATVAGPAGPKSEETKRNMSKAHMGHMISEETKRKISEVAKGRRHTDETKRKISEARAGGILSKEHKHKIGEANKGRVPWNKGKTLSEDTKRKMSKAKMGKAHGPMSEETKRKISKAQAGKTHSEETRRKMSESHKRWWAKQHELKGVQCQTRAI